MIRRSGTDRSAGLMAVLLGFVTMTTQIVLLREFLSVFAGNELVLGLVLSAWLALTGTGALVGRSSRLARLRRWSAGFLIGLPVLAVIIVVSLRLMRSAVMEPGVLTGPGQILVVAAALLLPFCLLSGWLFTAIARTLSADASGRGVSLAYALESLGSAVAAVLVSRVLVATLTPLRILLLLAAATSIALAADAKDPTRSTLRNFRALMAILSFGAMFLPLDDWSRSHLYPAQQLVEMQDTPYGSLAVTRQADQVNFFIDGVPLASGSDVIQREESVHFAMLQRPDTGNVLLIGGGVVGRAAEVLKYPVQRVDEVELDPGVLRLGRAYGPSLPTRVMQIAEDPRIFVRSISRRYGAVLLSVPDPSTALVNRLYTDEFFADVHRILDPGGVVSTSLMEQVEYQGEEARRVGSLLLNTLRRHFRFVVIIPGSRNYFLASDDSLRVDVARLARSRGIATTAVNEYYLVDDDLRARSQLLTSDLEGRPGTNTDLAPAAYGRYLRFWLSETGWSVWWPAVIVLLMLAALAYRMSPVAYGVMTVGFAGSSFEVILLLAYQVIHGSLYQGVGLLVGCFMGGIAAGSLLTARLQSSSRMLVGMLGSGALAGLMLPEILIVLKATPPHPLIGQAIVDVIAVLLGGLTGAAFGMATQVHDGSTAQGGSTLYSADLAGASLGALVASAWLIPAAGLTNTSFLTGAVAATGAVRLLRFRGGRRR